MELKILQTVILHIVQQVMYYSKTTYYIYKSYILFLNDK